MAVHFAISCTAASRVQLNGGLFGGAKPGGIMAACILLLEKLAVAGSGRGVIVGCLQQYRKRWGFVRMATSRAAWPKSIHDKQQQQQRELFFLFGYIAGRGGTGLVVMAGFS